mmetsp:Transcript_17418/g.28969  ORF Transcript_17418/g.28969 Transcript_17418/m.28969 type:complete len:85 (+) Transcript_17418:150-404(+)
MTVGVEFLVCRFMYSQYVQLTHLLANSQYVLCVQSQVYRVDAAAFGVVLVLESVIACHYHCWTSNVTMTYNGTLESKCAEVLSR